MLLQAQNITKRIGSATIIDQLSLELEKGQIIGLLGTNGAGKSTTLRMLCGIAPPTSGEVLIDEESLYSNNHRIKSRIGYASEMPNFPLDQSVQDILQFCASIRGVKNTLEATNVALDKLDLQTARKKPIRSLSKGFQQRVSIAQAIVHEPDIIILDEPTSGLDPSQLTGIRSLIKQLQPDHGIILSSHVLHEVEQLCTDAIIMSAGKVIHHCVLTDTTYRDQTLEIRINQTAEKPDFSNIKQLESVEQIGDGHWRATHIDLDDITPQVASTLIAQGFKILELRHQPSTLEHVFLSAVHGNLQ